MKRRYEHKVYGKLGKIESHWEEYLDTNDPYQLIKEAKEARDLLSNGFIRGSEFAHFREREGEDGVETTLDFADPKIRYVCSIGAVFKIQGHHAYDCNLITQLGKSGYILHPNLPTLEDATPVDIDWGEIAVDVNDRFGKNAALAMFDHTIAKYQQQIDYAESMAAQYVSRQRVSEPFRINLPNIPVNYGCGPNGCTMPDLVKEEVKA